MTISARFRALVLVSFQMLPTGGSRNTGIGKMTVLLTTFLLGLAAPVVRGVWMQWIRGLLTPDNGQSTAVRRFSQMMANNQI